MILQPCNNVAQTVPVSPDIQPSFGRQLLPPLGNESRQLRQSIDRDGHDLVCRRHFEVEPCLHGITQEPEIPVVDVPPVLAQVADDAVRSRNLAQVCRGHRIGFESSPRFTQRSHMVDVDGELHRRFLTMY